MRVIGKRVNRLEPREEIYGQLIIDGREGEPSAGQSLIVRVN